MLPATAPSDCLISPIVVEADVFAFVAPVIFVAAIPDVVLIVAVVPASLIPIVNCFADVPKILISLNVNEDTIESIVSLTLVASELSDAVSSVVFVESVACWPISFSLEASASNSKSACSTKLTILKPLVIPLAACWKLFPSALRVVPKLCLATSFPPKTLIPVAIRDIDSLIFLSDFLRENKGIG